MPSLALFDLDNTLLNREAAFALWARSFIQENDLSNDDWPIIEKFDADGFTPRELFFHEVRETLGITKDVNDLIADYNVKYPACYSIDEGTVRAVRCLRSNGWKVGVVTNGSPSQWNKFEVTNIAHEFDAVCISAIVGVAKPNVAIFEEAARLCGVPLAGWMVGDSATADIDGGKRAGLKTIWMSRGRLWDPSVPSPDAIVNSISEAVEVIMGVESA